MIVYICVYVCVCVSFEGMYILDSLSRFYLYYPEHTNRERETKCEKIFTILIDWEKNTIKHQSRMKSKKQ